MGMLFENASVVQQWTQVQIGRSLQDEAIKVYHDGMRLRSENEPFLGDALPDDYQKVRHMLANSGSELTIDELHAIVVRTRMLFYMGEYLIRAWS
jgi:hypothetical protein